MHFGPVHISTDWSIAIKYGCLYGFHFLHYYVKGSFVALPVISFRNRYGLKENALVQAQWFSNAIILGLAVNIASVPAPCVYSQ
jgi:hypothetical protein